MPAHDIPSPHLAALSLSKRQINNAGRIIASRQLRRSSDHFAADTETEEALEVVNQWRRCHAHPINNFQATLRSRVKRGAITSEALVAQRLKRMPTIIDKLKRESSMQLARMQDIGGVRLILPTIKDVEDAVELYKNPSKLRHELIGQKDYIETPRDRDGYRSVHLIYRYRHNGPYDKKLLVELQIRTKLQHLWATAVETTDMMLGQRLKFRQGDVDWQEFFCLVSSLFALREGKPALMKHTHLTKDEICAQLRKLNKKLHAIETLRGVSKAIKLISNNITHGKGSYNLIEVNHMNKTVTVTGFSQNSAKIAVEKYEALEKEIMQSTTRERECVLVSAGDLETIKRAYSSYFADIKVFLRTIEQEIKSAT